MAATQPLTRFASFSKSNKKRNNKNNVEYFSDNPAMNTSLDLISKLTAQAMPATVFKVTTAQPPLILSDASWQPRPPLLFGEGRVAWMCSRRSPFGAEWWSAESKVPQETLRLIATLQRQTSFICPLKRSVWGIIPDERSRTYSSRTGRPPLRGQPRRQLHRDKRIFISAGFSTYCRRSAHAHLRTSSQMVGCLRAFQGQPSGPTLTR